jgi:mono/diheme cytochrome c family protein
MTRRGVVALAISIAAIAVVSGSLAWIFDERRPPPGATRAERLYLGLCADCHGADGRGSWRAVLFLIKPGDFTDPKLLSHETDQYLAEIIKAGGSPLGRPGMPGFPQLSDDDIRALVAYLRTLPRSRS